MDSARPDPASRRAPSSRATAAVFAFALAARLAFWLLADQPLLYTHQYHYFSNAIRIAEHPTPVAYVIGSDAWRTWNGNWTIAPLYHLFLATVFGVAGVHLAPVRLLQCALDAVVAALVASLGRRVAGPRGAWAGVAYAVYWPAMEMPLWTLTENVHTPLFVAGVAILAGGETPRRAFLGGLILGLSALARSVSSGFIGLAALWRWWSIHRAPPDAARTRWHDGAGRRALAVGALLACGGAAIILPWTARNFFVIGDRVLIESAAFENLWWANHFTDPVRFSRQQEIVHSQATPAEKRAVALHFALRGPRRDPGALADKIGINFWHLFRPEGLHTWVAVQRSIEPWRHAGNLLLDDVPLLVALPLFAAFLAGGRRSPARSLIALWTAYYVFMVVVVFHNEIRYRSALMPFVFAGAAGALAAWGDPTRRFRLAAGFAVGAAISIGGVWPYAGGAWRALSASHALRPALDAVDGGRVAESRAFAALAVARDPGSPRVLLDYAQRMGERGHQADAAEAYAAAFKLATFANWRAPIGLSRYAADPAPWIERMDRASWDADPWLVLEAAWRELPPPAADAVRLARGDYGAVRGFLHPRGGNPELSAHRQEWNRYEAPGTVPPVGTHRWSRHRAWIRVQPTVAASAYEVTIEMGSPFPSPLEAPTVVVTVNDGNEHPFALAREIRPYSFRASPPAGEPLIVRIDAPTWGRLGEPADQGVRVDGMSVTPAR